MPYSLKTGQKATIPIAVVDSDGDPVDLTGKTVTVVIEGRSQGAVKHLEKTASVDAGVGGTGSFTLTAANTATDLGPGLFSLEVWCHDIDEDDPVCSDTVNVAKVPMRSA